MVDVVPLYHLLITSAASLVPVSHHQPAEADGCLVLPEVSSFEKGFLPSHCHQALLIGDPDCWDFSL